MLYKLVIIVAVYSVICSVAFGQGEPDAPASGVVAAGPDDSTRKAGALVVTDKYSLAALECRLRGGIGKYNVDFCAQVQEVLGAKGGKSRDMVISYGRSAELVGVTEIEGLMENVRRLMALAAEWQEQERQFSDATIVTERGFVINLHQGGTKQQVQMIVDGDVFELRNVQDLMTVLSAIKRVDEFLKGK